MQIKILKLQIKKRLKKLQKKKSTNLTFLIAHLFKEHRNTQFQVGSNGVAHRKLGIFTLLLFLLKRILLKSRDNLESKPSILFEVMKILDLLLILALMMPASKI